MIGKFTTDTATIKRPTGVSDDGLEGPLATIYSNVVCRLEVKRTHQFDSSDEYEDNRVDALAFFKTKFNIQEKDVIEHAGGENYTVKKVNKMKTIFSSNHLEVELVSR